MWKALLFLFISGGVGATALGLWFFFRRRRLRLQLATPSHTRRVQPIVRPLSAAPEDRRAGPETAEAAALGRSGDETPACASRPAAVMPAAADAAEVLEDPGSANAEEPVPVDRSLGPEPAQEAEPGSSDEGSDVCADTPVSVVGAAPETIEALDNSSFADAEGAVLGTDRHAGASLAGTEEPRTQASTATPDPRPPLPETAASGIVVSLGVPERSASGSAALAED